MAEGSIGFLFDANVSHKLVTILRVLGAKGLDTVTRRFGEGAKDQDWIPRAAEYGFTYITPDRNQLSDEMIAGIIRAANGRAVFLSARFANEPLWGQARWILRHWRAIEAATRDLPRGSIRYVRWNGQ